LWSALGNLKGYFDNLSKLIGVSECYDSSLSKPFRSFLEFGYHVFRKLPLSKQFINVVKSAYVCHFFRTDTDLLIAAYLLDPSNRAKWLTDEAINLGLGKIGLIIAQSREASSSQSGDDTDPDGIDDAFIDACSAEFRRYLSRMRKMQEPACDL